MRTVVAVCKKCKQNACVVDFLEHHTGAKVRMVRCQRICKSPVAGFEVDGCMEWFVRLGKAKPLAAMAKVLDRGEDGKIPNVLEKRRWEKLSGHAPR
jgi:hypothetical protein